jgi:hypothetical protein
MINKKKLVKWKIYIDRARMYLSYISFAMVAFVFLDAINDTRVRDILDNNRLLVYPVVMLLFFAVSLFLGYLDTKLGIRKEEMRNHTNENPVMMEIIQILRELKENQNGKET